MASHIRKGEFLFGPCPTKHYAEVFIMDFCIIGRYRHVLVRTTYRLREFLLFTTIGAGVNVPGHDSYPVDLA